MNKQLVIAATALAVVFGSAGMSFAKSDSHSSGSNRTTTEPLNGGAEDANNLNACITILGHPSHYTKDQVAECRYPVS